MLPSKALRESLGTLLASDTSGLANATPNKVALFVNSITPNENILMSALTLASFTGSSPKTGTAGDQGVANDPVTGDQVITILAPAGGWRWVCTADPISPQTVFGFVLTDATLATMIAIALLPAPVTISHAGQQIDLGALEITFVLQPMS
jgi:hypothetical protein